MKHVFLTEYAKKAGLSSSLPEAITAIYEVSACLKDAPEKKIYLLKARADGREYILKCTSRLCKEDPKSEYLLLSSMHHNGIPRAVFYFEEGDFSYSVREYAAGQTLDELVEKKGCLPAKQMVPIILQLCEILGCLHQQNPPVIHRDIKPQNIILTDDGQLKLIDLGISRKYHAGGKKDTVFMGTEVTAAPEQFGYMQTDVRSDIYSMGILMFYLLTGSMDIQKITVYAIPAALKRIISKCVKFSPTERFSSVEQLKSRLETLQKPHKLIMKIAIPSSIALMMALFFLLQSRGSMLPLGRMAFSSPLIEQAVLKELGKSEGEPVTYDELQKVTKLLICGDTIYSDWNEHRMYGKDHHMNGIPMGEVNGSITDLKDLTRMKNLTELALYGQEITDLTPLSGLKLKRLGLGSNNLQDISFLKDFKTLVSLNIADNPVSDLMPVRNLLSLYDLDISSTQVYDIYPITGLHIADLSVLETPIQDYTPLLNLPRLETLRARSMSSQGLVTILKLPALKNLTLYNSGIEDIGMFSSLPRLEFLDLHCNALKSIENIGSLSGLTYVNLGDNEIVDLSPITQLERLSGIGINGTLIKNFTPLSELPKLSFISCTQEQAEDIKKVLNNKDIQFWIQ